MKQKYYLGFTFLACVVIGFIVGSLLKPSMPINPAPEEAIDSVEVDTSLVEAISLEVSAPKLDKTTYSFTAKAINADGKALRYEVWDISKSKLVAPSDNGEFSNIPGCESGTYRVCVFEKANDADSLLVKKEVSGFNVVTVATEPVPTKQMTAANLQSLINARSQSIIGGRHPQVSKALTFTVEGENDMNGSNLSNIYSQLQYNVWQSCTVVSVEYDDKNKICHAVIRPNK